MKLVYILRKDQIANLFIKSLGLHSIHMTQKKSSLLDMSLMVTK